MKFGFRKPSLNKRIAARTSWKRALRHSAGFKAPRGFGFLTNPRKAIYNRAYNRTTIGIDDIFKVFSAKSNNRKITITQKSKIEGTQQDYLYDEKIIRSSHKSLTVTSNSFESLRNDINEIYTVEKQLKTQLQKTQVHYYIILFFNIITLFLVRSLKEKKNQLRSMIKKITENIENTFIELKFSDGSPIEKRWLNCYDLYIEIMKSQKIWDLVSTAKIDSVKARTMAQNGVEPKEILSRKVNQLSFIKSDLNCLSFPNLNGPDIYIFPTFLLIFKNYQTFGIYDLNEIEMKCWLQTYIEEDKVPSDSEILEYTWSKTNKDGSRDKRFKDNFQIPVVKYGSLEIKSDTGLYERYMFSNAKVFDLFSNELEAHMKQLRNKKKL